MNYQEMTMNEPRDSPERRKQFLVICTIMVATTLHAVINAGLFTTMDINDRGVFPGGDFVYKYAERDYAAMGSLVEHMGGEAKLKSRDFADRIYTIFLDDPRGHGGRRQRFAVGYLATDGETRKVKKDLLAKNTEIVIPTKDEEDEIGVFELWPKVKFSSTALPSVKSAVLQFPHTNGFVSALIFTYKVLPALRKYGMEHSHKGSPVVVITTCSIQDEMCTHYVPLFKGHKFHMGRPVQKDYIDSLPPERFFDFSQTTVRFKKMFPFLKPLLE